MTRPPSIRLRVALSLLALVGSGTDAGSAPRTAAEAIAVVAGLQEHPYRVDDPSGLFTTPEGRPTPAARVCADAYSPAADTRRTRMFDVTAYGARGNGRRGSFSTAPARRDAAPIADGFDPETAWRRLAKSIGGPRIGSTDPGDDDLHKLAVAESDWVGIQSAIIDAHHSGGGTVLLPDTGEDYLIDRGIWMLPNVNLVWLRDPHRPTHSYLRLVAPTRIVGAVVGPYNPYRAGSVRPAAGGEDDPERPRGLVCRVALIEPRIKAMTGENAIAFGLGTYGVDIVGGHLTGARYATEADAVRGFNREGGKAIQLESGVQQATIAGTRISDSTIGVSSSAGLFIKSRRADPNSEQRFNNASHRIHLRNVLVERADMPFLVSGVAYPGAPANAAAVAPQSVLMEGIEVRDSGLLTVRPKVPYENEDIRHQAGIFNLLGASNLIVREQSREHPNTIANRFEIGSLVRGYGEGIDIGDVRMNGRVKHLVDVHTPFGRLASRPVLRSVRIRSTVVTGVTGSPLRGLAGDDPGRTAPSLRELEIDVSTRDRPAPAPGASAAPAEPHIRLRVD